MIVTITVALSVSLSQPVPVESSVVCVESGRKISPADSGLCSD